MRLRRCSGTRRLLASALACVAAIGSAHAQDPSDEAAAKAKFAITLARFVRWPASASATDLRLCVLHRSRAIAGAFGAYDGSTVAGRMVQVVSNPATLVDACDLVFVDASGAATIPAALEPSGSAPMLTLGAVDGFLSHGGMVELVNVNDALRFDVNLAALRGSGLALNSQALKLARRVQD